MTLPVAGQYSGNLANGRERLRLVDAQGGNVLDFTFEADWHKSADGRGHSLVTANERASHPAWDYKTNRLASACTDGSPSADDPATPCETDSDTLPDRWELECTNTLASLTALGDADHDGAPDAVNSTNTPAQFFRARWQP